MTPYLPGNRTRFSASTSFPYPQGTELTIRPLLPQGSIQFSIIIAVNKENLILSEFLYNQMLCTLCLQTDVVVHTMKIVQGLSDLASSYVWYEINSSIKIIYEEEKEGK